MLRMSLTWRASDGDNIIIVIIIIILNFIWWHYQPAVNSMDLLLDNLLLKAFILHIELICLFWAMLDVSGALPGDTPTHKGAPQLWKWIPFNHWVELCKKKNKRFLTFSSMFNIEQFADDHYQESVKEENESMVLILSVLISVVLCHIKIYSILP